MAEVKTYYVNDDALKKAHEDELRRNQKMMAENERLIEQNKRLTAEAKKNSEARRKDLAAEIVMTQAVKRSRQELIASTNFVQSRRDGGALIPGQNWVWGRATPSPPSGGLIPRPGGYGGLGGLIVPGAPLQFPRDRWGELHAGNAQRHLDQTLAKPLGMLSGNLVKTVAGFATLHSLLDIVNTQYELRIRLEQNAAQAQRSLAAGQAMVILNTPGMSQADRQKLFGAAQAISRETGFSEQAALDAIGIQSGRGTGLSAESSAKSATIASMLTRHTPEQFKAMSMLIQQITRIGKTDDVRAAAALADTAGAAAFQSDPTMQSEFLTEVLSGTKPSIPNADFDSAVQALQIGGWISQASGVDRAHMGRTSAISALAQFEQFRQGEGAWTIDMGHGFMRHPAIKNAPTKPVDFIHWLHANPHEAKRFLGKFHSEIQMEGIWRNAIKNPQGEEAQLLEQTLGVVKPDKAALDRHIADIMDSTPQLKTATEANRSAQIAQQYAARNTIAAREAEARAFVLGQEGQPSVVDQTDRYTGDSKWFRDKRMWLKGGLLGQNPEDIVRSELERSRHQIRWKTGGGQSVETLDSELTAGERSALKLIEDTLTRLDKIAEELKGLRADANKKAPSAGPAMQGKYSGGANAAP